MSRDVERARLRLVEVDQAKPSAPPELAGMSPLQVAEAALNEAQQNIALLQRQLELQQDRWRIEVAAVRLAGEQRVRRVLNAADRAGDLLSSMLDRIQSDAGRLDEARSSRSESNALVSTLAGALANLRHGAAAAVGPAPAAVPGIAPSPQFAEVAAAFLGARHDYTVQTRSQVAATIRLFTEIVGDVPVRTMTGAEAGRFLDVLRRLPASHGKSGTPVSAPDAIAAADLRERSGTPVPRLSEKTIKRHSSAMSQLWIHLMPLGHVDRNVFEGHRFPGTKNGRQLRTDWNEGDVRLLLERPWRSKTVSAATYRWLVAIAAYSGMRVEEICRLRPSKDVIKTGDTWLFDIKPHPDGWTPKSAAGTRQVPVHPELLKLGFLPLVKRMEDAKSTRLLSDLAPSGPDQDYSSAFVRDFSRHKTAAGVSVATTFHSWRHNASTILRNQASSRSEYIDRLLGHEDSTGSQGASTYMKRVDMPNLVSTIKLLRYDFDLPGMLREAMHR